MKKTNLELIRDMRRRDPHMRANHMAKILGISRERVRQILIQLHLSTAMPQNKHYCIDCGKVVSQRKRCSKCAAIWHASKYLFLRCDNCNKSFTRLKSVQKSNFKWFKQNGTTNFCSRACFYEYYGRKEHHKES